MKFMNLIPPNTNINFVGKFRYFLVFSLAMLLLTAWGMYKGMLKYGIDFTGGTVMQVKFSQPLDAGKVRGILENVGEPGATVVALGTQNDEYMITTRTVQETTTESPLNVRVKEKLDPGVTMEVLALDIVGPKVGEDLKWAAIRSLFYTIILVTIYIWFRFDFRFAPGATVAMIHDLCMTLGFYLLTGVEFSITAVAALLTIAGYSVNDTIVIYDRAREFFKDGGADLPLGPTLNKALNITLSRTLITVTLVLLSIIPIMIYCTGEIQDFAMAMAFGMICGTYSTMYIAVPMAIYVQKFMEKRNPGGAPRPKKVVTA